MRKIMIRHVLLLAALAFSGSAAAESTAYRLNLQAVDEMPGTKAAFIRGATTTEGDRYFVEHLMLNQPVMVRVFAPHESNVTVGLSKFRWDEFEKQASTRGSGLAEFKVRTQGEMRLVIRSDEADVPYYAAVVVGDEIQPEMKPVITAASSASTGTSPMLYAAGGLILILLAVIVMLLRRRKT